MKTRELPKRREKEMTLSRFVPAWLRKHRWKPEYIESVGYANRTTKHGVVVFPCLKREVVFCKCEWCGEINMNTIKPVFGCKGRRTTT